MEATRSGTRALDRRTGASAAAFEPIASVLNGPGRPLERETRAFFEPRFGFDFSNVRIHDDRKAARSAERLRARAWTIGHDIAFGAGAYVPSTPAGRRLIAHELAHVVVQERTGVELGLSALSTDVESCWKADPSMEALLERLARSDVQNAQADTDVDTTLQTLLQSRPDDLWLAQRIRQGRLGTTTGALGPKAGGKPVPRPIEALYFRGTTDRRALVIAGVHGTERQGMDVARMLIADLQKGKPVLSVIVVPSLFPDNAAQGPFGIREGATPTNRNFPDPSKSLDDAKAAGGGTAVDAIKRPILPENVMLLQLIERFHPERIISIHGTTGPGSAGVFFDQRTLQPAEEQASILWAERTALERTPLSSLLSVEGLTQFALLVKQLLASRLAELRGQDEKLSAAAVKQIDADTANIANRSRRDMSRESESAATVRANSPNRRAHPSVAGNVGPTGKLDNFTWSGSIPGGVSLGGYAPPRGISVFTVEPPINRASTDYPTQLDAVSAAERRVELQAYADAVRTILLGA